MCRINAIASFLVPAIVFAATPIGSARAQGSCTEHPTSGGSGLGEAVNIDFAPDSTIDEALVVVATGFLRPWVVNAFALDITITSIDGTNHFHGTDVVPLSDMTIFSVEGERADLVVAWTEDNEPRVIGDVYTVCSQLLLGAPIGPARCRSFGPF